MQCGMRMQKAEMLLEEPCRPHGPTRANQPLARWLATWLVMFLFEAGMERVGDFFWALPATGCSRLKPPQRGVPELVPVHPLKA
jgi:hypothetical protein